MLAERSKKYSLKHETLESYSKWCIEAWGWILTTPFSKKNSVNACMQ